MRKNSGSTITTMLYSSFHSDETIIKTLVDHGYHKDCMDLIRDQPILVSAIHAQRPVVASWMIRNGSDMDLRGGSGESARSALMSAREGAFLAEMERMAMEDAVTAAYREVAKKTCCASI
jgi:hypothetical protein